MIRRYKDLAGRDRQLKFVQSCGYMQPFMDSYSPVNQWEDVDTKYPLLLPEMAWRAVNYEDVAETTLQTTTEAPF